MMINLYSPTFCAWNDASACQYAVFSLLLFSLVLRVLVL